MNSHDCLTLVLLCACILMYGREASSQEDSICRSTGYRELSVHLKMEHMCLMTEQTQNELFVERDSRYTQTSKLNIALTRINHKLNYILQYIDESFNDPFTPMDERTLYDAFLTLRDEYGTEWKLIKAEDLLPQREEEEVPNEEGLEGSDAACKGDVIQQIGVDAGPDDKRWFPRDCYEILETGEKSSGIYLIKLFNGHILPVYCDMHTDGGGWTLLQRRGTNGSIAFERNWKEYRHGFGNVNSDFWLGNEAIHYIATNRNSSLRIDIWDWEGGHAYAEYYTFYVSSEHDNYTLIVHGYDGTAGDALAYHSAVAFSTPDVDNDQWDKGHCAAMDHAGWWYKGCAYATLNSRYYNRSEPEMATKKITDGIVWYHWKESYLYLLRKVEIKTKPAYV